MDVSPLYGELASVRASIAAAVEAGAGAALAADTRLASLGSRLDAIEKRWDALEKQLATAATRPAAAASVYDLAAAGMLAGNASEAAQAANVTAFNRAAEWLGADGTGTTYGHQRGILHPLYLAAGAYHTSAPLVIGVSPAVSGNGATVPRKDTCGGRLNTGGGLTPAMIANAMWSQGATATRIVYCGPRGAGETVLACYGYGWFVDALEVHGIRLVSGQDYQTRHLLPKAACGVKIDTHYTSGTPTGKTTFAALSLVGCERGLDVPADQSNINGGNCDNITVGLLHGDTCRTLYHVGRKQSVTHLVAKVITDFYVDTIFAFDGGGDLHVGSIQVNGPNCTLLEIGTAAAGWDSGGFELRNVKIDNVAANPTLLRLTGAAASRGPVSVVITGAIHRAEHDPKKLIVGELRKDDKIFIRFTGPASVVGPINALSTVTEAPF